MKIKKKSAFFGLIFLLLPLSLNACVFNTEIDVKQTLCRRYFLKKYISFVDNDVIYDELPDENKYDISSIFTTEMVNEKYTHIDFHYDGSYEFLLSNSLHEEMYYERGTYFLSGSVNRSEKTTLNSHDGETKECTSVFIRKSDQDTIITYLRVPFKMKLSDEEEEENVFLWFFNGIFVECVFSEDSSL